MNKELMSLVNKKKHYIVMIVIFMLLDMISSIMLAAFISYALYDLVYLLEKEKLWVYLLFGVIYIFIKINLNIIIGKLKATLGSSIESSLRQKTFDKIIEYNCDIKDHDKISLSTLCVEGVEQLNNYYKEYIPSVFFAIFAPIVFLILFLVLDWKIGLIFGISFPIIPLLIYLVNKQTLKMMNNFQDAYLKIGSHYSDSLFGILDIKHFQSTNFIDDTFYEQSQRYQDKIKTTLLLQLLCLSVVDLIAYVGTSICIIIGIMDISRELLNAFACLFVIMMALDVFIPLKTLAHAYNIAMKGQAAGQKVLSIINLPSPNYGNEAITKDDLVFDNVSFAYKNHRYVIKSISFTINLPGIYGFVGRSGAGKSTIIKLLMRSLVPQSGMIRLGDKNIYSIGRNYYYSKIDFVSYESHLFNDTVRNNFLLVNPYVTEREIHEAIKTMRLEYLIERIGGIDSLIVQNGIKFSNGERQRLIIAMHLTLNRFIRIFDEATSNIDQESEEIINSAIKELSKSCVVILSTHRLINLVDANKIFVLSKKGLVEMGTHETLISLNGEYAKMYMENSKIIES